MLKKVGRDQGLPQSANLAFFVGNADSTGEAEATDGQAYCEAVAAMLLPAITIGG